MLFPELFNTELFTTIRRRNRYRLIIPRYTGSKRKVWPLIVGQGHYDAIIEPFAGGGSLSSRFATKWPAGAVFAADQNNCVRAVWQCWSDPGLHEAVYRAMDELISAMLAEFVDSVHGLGYTVAELSPLPAREAIGLKAAALLPETWPALMAEYEAGLVAIADPARLAAVTLILHAVTYGGVSRDTPGSETLNIAPNYGQLEELTNPGKDRYCFPPAPAFPGLVSISGQWEEAISAFEASSYSRGLAVLDPPYWLPYTPGTERGGTGAMSPSYFGHRPHAPETLAMAVDSARAMASSNKVARLVASNYYSAELDEAMKEIASAAGLQVHCHCLGVLNGLNRSRKSKTTNLDALWIFDKLALTKVQAEKAVAHNQEELTLWAS